MSRVDRKIRKFLPEPSEEFWRGKIVKKGGSATVSDNPLYCWVRPEGGGQPLPIYNDSVPHQAGRRVKVGRDKLDRTVRVLHGIYSAGTDQTTNPNVGPHAASHRKSGVDPVDITEDQITNLLVIPTTGMSVKVYPGRPTYQGQVIRVATTTVDLTSSIPGAGARYSLIRISSTGAVSVQDGTAVDSLADLTDPGDVPTCAAGYAAIAYVRLYFGQTALSKLITSPDVRMLVWGGGLFDVSGFVLADHDHSGDAGDGGTFDVANLTSGAATAGYVPTADGAGGVAWDEGGGGGHEIQDEGTPMTQRAGLNFIGFTVEDDAGNDVTKVTAPSFEITGDVSPAVCHGRLTLESGVPVSTSNQAAKTTLYFTPFMGNLIGLYNGTDTWTVYAFTEKSLDISGYTANKNYDIWMYDNAGTPALDSTIWTNDTTRATALTTQDGIYVKTGATTRRYLGTIRITGTTGQCEYSTTGTAPKLFVWNYYNRINRTMAVAETTSHTYNGAARKWNNSDTNNLLQYVIGVIEDDASVVQIAARLNAGAAGTYAVVGLFVNNVLFDGTDSSWLGILGITTNQYLARPYIVIPSLGYSFSQVGETGNHNSATFFTMHFRQIIRG